MAMAAKKTTRKPARMGTTMSRPVASKKKVGKMKEEGMKRNTKPKKAVVHRTVRKKVAHPKVVKRK